MKYGSSFSEIVFSLRGFGSSGLGVLREVSFSLCCRCGEYALIIERSAIGGLGRSTRIARQKLKICLPLTVC